MQKYPKQKNTAFTLLEVLIAAAVFCIILLVVLVNFKSSNKLSELKTATDNLADDIRYLQSLIGSTRILVDSPTRVERGYAYIFTEAERNFNFYQIFSDTENNKLFDFTYTYLGIKEFTYSTVQLIGLQTSTSGLGQMNNKVKTNLFDFSRLVPNAQAAGATKQINFLFPGYFYSDYESIQIIDYFGVTERGCSGQFCTNLILFLKHDDVSDKAGKVTINKWSGRVTSEIVDYP